MSATITREGGADQLRPVTPHGILSALIDQLHDRLLALDTALPDDCVSALRRARALASGLDPYLDRTASPPSDSLRALGQATLDQDWTDLHRRAQTEFELEAEMLCGPVEARFLATLVRMTGAQRVLEIGMFTGYSTLAMAEALPEAGRLITLEREPWLAGFARPYFERSGHGHKIDVRLGDATAQLERLAEERAEFDLVFIDAMKTQYIDYYQAVMGGLLAADGTIVVDNTLMQGQSYVGDDPPANGAAIRAFNEAVASDPRASQVLLPIRDGITLITRR
ncbi:MAG: class I SAM-dependent methyltransferase [Myxococcota bacterium]